MNTAEKKVSTEFSEGKFLGVTAKGYLSKNKGICIFLEGSLVLSLPQQWWRVRSSETEREQVGLDKNGKKKKWRTRSRRL